MMNNNIHIFKLRVYYEDTDAGGVVYYANYLKFAERARSEMLRELGGESSKYMDSDGVVLAVHHCSADYLKPARLDDELEVHTRISDIGGAALHLQQTVVRGDEDIANMKIRLVCMTLSGKSTRLPASLKKILEDYYNSNEQA